MRHSFRYPNEELLKQIQHHVESDLQGRRHMAIPSQEECEELRDKALEGDEIAIERVFKLWAHAELPVNVQQRVSLALIFDAHAQVNRKLKNQNNGQIHQGQN